MKDKILKIFEHYGVMNQLKHFNGEVFELNEAVINYTNQSKYSPIHEDHIAEEIADVMVMLKGIQYYYDISDSKIELNMDFKLDRQLSRIKEE